MPWSFDVFVFSYSPTRHRFCLRLISIRDIGGIDDWSINLRRHGGTGAIDFEKEATPILQFEDHPFRCQIQRGLGSVC